MDELFSSEDSDFDDALSVGGGGESTDAQSFRTTFTELERKVAEDFIILQRRQARLGLRYIRNIIRKQKQARK